MVLLRRANDLPTRLGILPGTFNPPTRAHLALAAAALNAVDAVLFVLPATLPHKSFDGASREQRRALLLDAVADHPRFLAAESAGGLLIEIARECREHFPEVPFSMICGRDAAERIVNWAYEPGLAIEKQLEDYELLVAGRQGAFEPPPAIASRVRPLIVSADIDGDSATEVRRRLATGEPWRHLVPPSIHRRVESIYAPAPASFVRGVFEKRA